jgi:hypothetical protein
MGTRNMRLSFSWKKPKEYHSTYKTRRTLAPELLNPPSFPRGYKSRAANPGPRKSMRQLTGRKHLCEESFKKAIHRQKDPTVSVYE